MKLLNKYTLISILALTFVIAYNVSAKTALTPLHLYKWAQEHNVSRLHQFHKYINLKNPEGSTALCIAQQHKDKQAYDLLLRFGASTNVACHNPNDDVCTIKTTTKLEKTNYTTPALIIGAGTGIAALALGGGGSKAQPPTSCPLGYSTQYQAPVDCSSTGNDQGWILITHESIRIDDLPCNKCEKISCPIGDTSYISSSNCPFIDDGLLAISQESQYYSGDDNCYTCSYQCNNETKFDYHICRGKFSECSSEYSFSYENTSIKCYTPDPCEETFDTAETIGCPSGLKPISRCTEPVDSSYNQNHTLLQCICNESSHFEKKEDCEERNLGYECRQKEGETCFTVYAPLECATGYATFVNSCGRIGGYTLGSNQKGYSEGLPCYQCVENTCNEGYNSGLNIENCDISNGYTYTQDSVSNGERTCGKCEATPCPLGSKIYPSAAHCDDVDYDGQGWKLVKTGVSGGMNCSICEKIKCTEGLTSCPTYPNLKLTSDTNTYYSGNNACYTCSYTCREGLYNQAQASECKSANAGSDCLEINENSITCYAAETQCKYDIYSTHNTICPTGAKEVGRCVDSNDGTKYTHLKCECDAANGYYADKSLCLAENPGYECDGSEAASNCVTKGTIKQCPEHQAPQDELSCDTHEHLNLLPMTATEYYNGEKRCYQCNYSAIYTTSNSCESANPAKACSPKNITIKGKEYQAYYVSGCNLDKGYYENEQGCPDGYECSELNGCLYKSSQTPCEIPTSVLYIDATKCPLYDTSTRETTVTPTGFKNGDNDCYSCSYTCRYTGKDHCEEENNGLICDAFDGCYAPTECNPSKGYYTDGTDDCMKANPGYQCNQKENKCIVKGDEKTQCNNINASPAYISNANCPTHDAVKKESSTKIADDYIGTSNCYTCNYTCTYSSDKECYDAPSALGRICEPTDISLLGNTYTCYEIKGCNETTHFLEQKDCEEHENNKRYQCTKENGCYTKSNTPLACKTGTTENPINHPSLSYVSREETGLSGEKTCYIYTYKCNNENSNHYYDTCPAEYTSCRDITINVSHASQESYTCYTPNPCDTSEYNNLEQCTNFGQIPEEDAVCKDTAGTHLKCKCDQDNGFYPTKEDCLAVHKNRYKCDAFNESGTCIIKGSPETCPEGHSTKYQSINDCGTSGSGPKDKSQGWIYSSDETIFAGEEKCGKCEARVCDTKNGYTSGLNASKCDTENGYNYFSADYNGDNICGKCEKRTCSEGFSTQYQSLEDCGKYNDGKIGWVFESDGKSEGLVCGKCKQKTCQSQGQNFINIQTQQTQVGNCKNYAFNQGITFLEEDSFSINQDFKEGDYDCVHCAYKCGPDTPYTSETECIKSQGDNTVKCTKHTISNFFGNTYTCYSVNGCDENIYPFTTCPTGLISSSECSITGDTRHACICDKTQGYYIPSEETACQDGVNYTCSQQTIEGVDCLKRTCNVATYPFVGSCPAGTKVKSSCTTDGETRYSCECDTAQDYYSITNQTSCLAASGDKIYTCTETQLEKDGSSVTCYKRTCNTTTYPFEDSCPTGTAITSTCQTKNDAPKRHTCACDENQGYFSVDEDKLNDENFRNCLNNQAGLRGYECDAKSVSDSDTLQCYTRTPKTCATGFSASAQKDIIACQIIEGNDAVNTQGWSILVDDANAAGEKYCVQCVEKTCPDGGKAIETEDFDKPLETLSGLYCASKPTNTTGWTITLSEENFAGEKKCGYCKKNECKTGKKSEELKCEEKEGGGWMFSCNGNYSGNELCGECGAVACESHEVCSGGRCSKQEDISTCPIVEKGKEGGWTIKDSGKKSGDNTCYACSPKACEVGTALDVSICPIYDEYLKIPDDPEPSLGMFAGNEQCYSCSYTCLYSDCSKVPLNEGETCSHQNITITIPGKDPVNYTCPKKDIAPTPASANQTFIGKTGRAGETIVNPIGETISMQTFGDNSFVGMYTQTGGTAINEGKIEITGNTGTAIGILGDGQNTIENKGTINVSGEHAYGIKVIDGTDTSITNSGEINVSATSDAYGIYIEENGNLATVTNTGTISINGNLNDKNNAIVLNGAELRNQNQFNVEGDLNIKSLQASAFVVERGSQISAQSVEGELTAGISTVQSDENKDQYVEENSVVANDTSNLEVKSESALFKASTQQNAQGNTNIVLDRKDFKEFTPNSSMGEYLNQNYQDGNFVDTFNSMKEATSAFDIASKSVKFMGADNMLNFVDENIQVLRGLNRNIAETILTPDDDKPYRVLSGAHNYSLETDDKGLLSGYDINSNSVYMFGDKRLNNWSRLGLGLSFTDINSSYEHGGSRDLSYVNIFVPYLYKFNPNLNLASILSFGYGYGDFERDAIHTSELSQFTYGLTNELRYTMDLNGFAELEPALMLNVLGYHENGLSEGKDDTAIITKNNHALSVEAGLGLFVKKQVKTSENSKLGFKIGGIYYHEFASPYRDITARHRASNHWYKINDYANLYKHDRAVLEAVVDYMYKDISVYLKYNKLIQNNNPELLDLGIKYNF